MANTPKVYVICDQNCKWEGMTKEQILTAITQAVNNGTIGDIDTGFITTIKAINGVGIKFFYGTQAQHNELTDEDKTNLCAIITDDTSITGINKAITELNDTIKSIKEGLISGDFVVAEAMKAKSANCLNLRAIDWTTASTVLTDTGLYALNIKCGEENYTVLLYVTNLTEKAISTLATTQYGTGNENFEIWAEGELHSNGNYTVKAKHNSSFDYGIIITKVAHIFK